MTNRIQKCFSDDRESRTITLSGSPDQLDEVMRMLAFMSMCNLQGHSTSIKFAFDGDGCANVQAFIGEPVFENSLPQKLKGDPKWDKIVQDYGDKGIDPEEFSIGY